MIDMITYEQERLNYFTDLMNKAQRRYKRLFKQFKNAHYLSEEQQKLSDAGRVEQFHRDVVDMLEKGRLKPRDGEWIKRIGYYTKCSVCNTRVDEFIFSYNHEVEYLPPFCPHCGARMKGGVS